MYANSRAYKNLKSTDMNTKNTTPAFNLIAIGLVAISFFVTSCTSLQQTTTVATDDLYYTPSKPAEQVVAQNQEDTYQDYQNYQDDRYLRLKVANRNRWSTIDDWGYWNDPRFNYSFYPSYLGWNSWYTGYYGSSWFSPFGPSYMMGWGGYYPYSSFGYGFGFNDFAFGGFGGFGYSGFGFGGFGYGGWNPYYAGFWNPYGSYYQYGGIYGGIPMNVRNYDKRVPVQPNRTNLNPYMKNIGQFRRVGDVRENGSFVNSNSNGNLGARSNGNNSFRSINSNSASSSSNGGNFSSSNSNTTQPSTSNFGSLVKRVMTASSNARAASFNNSSRNYSSPNNSYQNSTPTRSSSTPSYTAPVSSGSSSGGSGGGGFIGGGRSRGGGGRN
jgi:hypothetical protein